MVDPSTVRITLKQPAAPFLELLAAAEAVIADSKWATSGGGDLKKAASGTGPFKLGPYETGVRYSLVKHPDYWESPYPYLDRIELSTVAKDDVRVQALTTGSVDLAEYIPWQEIKALEKDPQIKVHVGYDTFNVIRMNPKRPPFDNVKVRQALNYLVDRKEIIELAWGGIGRPFGAGLIPEGHWAFPKALQGTWSYDPAKGKSLLTEAGVNPGATKIVFDSTTLSVHMDSAQIIVTQLQRAGFTQIELKPMDVPTQQRKRVSGEYQMMMDGFSLPWPDPDFYASFFATGGTSYARAVEFSDAALDKLLVEGRSVGDQAKRAAVYAQVEQRVVELAPWVFLHWRPQAEAHRTTVARVHALAGGDREQEPGRPQVHVPGGLSDGVRRRGFHRAIQHGVERARRGRDPRDDDGRRRVRGFLRQGDVGNTRDGQARRPRVSRQACSRGFPTSAGTRSGTTSIRTWRWWSGSPAGRRTAARASGCTAATCSPSATGASRPSARSERA